MAGLRLGSEFVHARLFVGGPWASSWVVGVFALLLRTA